MQEQRELLKRLQAEQTKLLAAAAKAGTMPPHNMLRQIADLELAVGAVENLLHETEKKR